MTQQENCTSFCHFDRREKSSSSPVSVVVCLVDFSASGLEMTQQENSTSFCHFDRREKSSSSPVSVVVCLVDFSASGLEMTQQKDRYPHVISTRPAGRNLLRRGQLTLSPADFSASGLEMTQQENSTSFCHFDRREKSSSSPVSVVVCLADFSASGLEMTQQKD